MLEGFLEMESAVSKMHQRLEIEGYQEYYKLEYCTERFMHTPEPGSRPVERANSAPTAFFRKLWKF